MYCGDNDAALSSALMIGDDGSSYFVQTLTIPLSEGMKPLADDFAVMSFSNFPEPEGDPPCSEIFLTGY